MDDKNSRVSVGRLILDRIAALDAARPKRGNCSACGFNGPDRGAEGLVGPKRCPVCGSIGSYRYPADPELEGK